MKQRFTIKQLKSLVEGKARDIPKALGVELVDLGFYNYKKLNKKNYNYWWYEVPDGEKIDKKAFTYSWCDMVKTQKFDYIELLIDRHKDNESIYPLITNILNLESARGLRDKETGVLDTDTVLKSAYKNIKIRHIKNN